MRITCESAVVERERECDPHPTANMLPPSHSSLFSFFFFFLFSLSPPQGAGMFNHQDVLRTASFQAQVLGSKRWHLCSPSQSRFLYGAGELDTFDPDYNRFPLYAQASCYEDVVEEGEVIFYPADWWHQTENVRAPSVALTTTVIDTNNHVQIAQELREECDRQKYKWGFSAELCESLKNQCFAYWTSHFGLPGKDEL